MKRIYNTPIIELTCLNSLDIILSSNNVGTLNIDDTIINNFLGELE